jgi:5-methylcytosine-specific restriction endonuclease McrA
MPGPGSTALSKAMQADGGRVSRKAARIAQEKKHEREVHQAVDARDHHTCRVCGRYCSPLAVGLLQRSHRHHLVYRSAGGKDTTENLCTLCAHCHDDEHHKRIRLSGDADLRDKKTGKLAGVKVERATESGYRVEKWV